MKIGKYNLLFDHKGKKYEELDDMFKGMSFSELKEREEELKKILNDFSEKRNNEKKEIGRSKVMIVAGGVLLCLSPFPPAGILKCTCAVLGLTALTGAVWSYKKERYKKLVYTFKMLTTKYEQREIVKEMQGRLNGTKPFSNSNPLSNKVEEAIVEAELG